MNIRGMTRIVALVTVMSIVLSGCGPIGVTHNIAVFHNIDESAPKTFAVIPLKEQEGSLEWSSYANRIKQGLISKGYKEVTPEQATYAVFFSYGIDEGKQVVSSYPIYGQTGTRSSHTTGTVSTYGNMSYINATTYNTPTYGITGTGVSSSIEYTRFLKVEMIDGNILKEGKVKKLYESTVKSVGSSGAVAAVMPSMIKALFEDFPGNSGSTRRTITSIEK